MHFSTTKLSPYVWIYSVPFCPKGISSPLKTTAALIPRPRIHFSNDSRSRVAKARPATCQGWCHSYLRSPLVMFPSVLPISEAAGIDGFLHPASWHTVLWMEKPWRIQSEPPSGRCNNRNNQHMNLLASRAPATLVTRQDLARSMRSLLQASPSLSVPPLRHPLQVSSPALLAGSRDLLLPLKLPFLLGLEDSQAPVTNTSSPDGHCA